MNFKPVEGFVFKEVSSKSIAGRRLVDGVGINDAPYQVQPMVNGKQICCPFYRRWKSMVGRCYSEHLLQIDPQYLECFVNNRWHYFMPFRAWMEDKIWQGLHLDKDMLVPENKEYSPDTCVFIPHYLNCLLTTRSNYRGKYPLGVKLAKSANVTAYQGVVNGGERGKELYMGRKPTPMEAHHLWQRGKIQVIHENLKRYEKEEFFIQEVKESLIRRANKIQEDLDNKVETFFV